MFIFIVVGLVIGFLLGWAWRDFKWTRCADKDMYMCIDNRLYEIKKHINEHVGG